MTAFIYSLRDGCYTTEYKSKQRHVVIVCQGYIIGVRRYRVKSPPLQVFCNQLVDKISVSKTLNALVAGSFFWVVGSQLGRVFFVVSFVVGSVGSVCCLLRCSVEVVSGFRLFPWHVFVAC